VTVPAHIAAARTRRANAMTATCVITRPGAGTLDAETNEISADPAAVYSGCCTVLPESASTTSDAGEELRDLDAYLLRLPATVVGVLDGDLVAVADDDDPDLAELRLKVIRVDARTTRVFRTVHCVDTRRVRSAP